MSKLIGKFEDLVDINKDDTSLEPYEQDEESVYWMHRTCIPQLYFNPNYKLNGCPMILTFDEIQDYHNQGKDIKDCIAVDLYYNDQEEKDKVDSIVSEDELEKQVIERLNESLKSFFEKGIYMPNQYGEDLERVANQASAHKIQKLLDRNNFGFNGYRILNVVFILEIPQDADNICVDLAKPIEIATEYLGIQKVTKAISPEYIKGAVFKVGNKKIFIKNPKYKNNELNDMLDDTVESTDNIKKER